LLIVPQEPPLHPAPATLHLTAVFVELRTVAVNWTDRLR
jgi:hypothetical protein